MPELTKFDRIVARLSEAKIPAPEIHRGIWGVKEELPLLSYEGAACLFAARRKVLTWKECMEL